MPRLTPHLALLLLSASFFGCPATVEILESTSDGDALTFAAGYDMQRFTVDISTPEDAFPSDSSYSEIVTVTAVFRTDLRRSGEAEVELLVSAPSDQEGDVRHGQSRRATVFGSETVVSVERFFFHCDEPPCASRIDVDFLKSGDAEVTGTWRVDHQIDWHGENNDPPADAVSTLAISSK